MVLCDMMLCDEIYMLNDKYVCYYVTPCNIHDVVTMRVVIKSKINCKNNGVGIERNSA